MRPDFLTATANASPRAAEKRGPAKPQKAKLAVQSRPHSLAALKSLPGYVQGGPVSASRSPFNIAGKAWNSPGTYYYTRGKITAGDKIDPKRVERGTLIFYKKP